MILKKVSQVHVFLEKPIQQPESIPSCVKGMKELCIVILMVNDHLKMKPHVSPTGDTMFTTTHHVGKGLCTTPATALGMLCSMPGVSVLFQRATL